MVAADRMVLSTAGLARRSGLSPFIIGAVIIGFGSSLPEMMVSILALDQPNGLDLAVGNVVGSNIANISLVLGASVLFFPVAGQASIVKREGLLMLASLAVLTAVLWDGELSAWDGGLLVVGLIVAGLMVVRWAKSAPATVEGAEPAGDAETLDDRPVRRLVLESILGLGVVVAGARAMVVGAESIALELGITESVVGLTILALGTSLPELGTALASARRGQGDLVFGNVLGSNVFNALAVAGGAGLIGPGSLTDDFGPGLIAMIVVAALGGVVAWSGDRMIRFEGALLLLAYPIAIAFAL